MPWEIILISLNCFALLRGNMPCDCLKPFLELLFVKSIFHEEKSEPVALTTFAFVAEGFDGSWQKSPHAGFQLKPTSNGEEP
ncbi:MAG: hypothetical protein LBP61_05915 [Desulfovibrio sp.]|nr:hypothetical protein [Desulfovibrio sp.]